MCGIAGIVSFESGNAGLSDLVQQMTRILRHRGPDDEGFTYFSSEAIECTGGKDTPHNVWESRFPFSPQHIAYNERPIAVLGHRRLSILDTSAAGHQPMCDSSKRYWIVFNGEIYNYKEIRSELLLLGHTFYSQCDTEIILQAYIAWGKDCVHKFNGMWAFALYDHEKKSVFCSRDRFGVKPFYYFVSDRYFAFASELKALVSLPFIEKRINEKAVYDYLVLGQTESEPEGFFKNIFELEPSHHLLIKDGAAWKEKYYSLGFNEETESFSGSRKKQFTEHISYLIYDAVKLRMRSDVPVGACLSGGIDSSALVCTANNLSDSEEPLHVFTSIFPGSPVDESYWAKKVVEATATQWHTIETQSADLLQQYESLIYSQDIPFFGSSTLSQSKVMELIHQTGIKVTLDGQGADELFSGYPQHFYISAWKEIKRGNISNLKYLERAEPNAHAYFVKFLLKKALSQGPSAISYPLLKESKYDFQVLHPDFWSEHQNRYITHKLKYPDNLNAFLHQEFAGPSLKYLMRTADRNSMRHSVESRVPFADDHRLAEYLFSIPSVYKIHCGESKYLLRESMKGIIPDSIRQRKDKKGFATPELKWFREHKNELKNLLSDNLEPFVNTKLLHKNWDKIFSQKLAGNTLGISRFIILSIWRKRFGI